jgi:hypothetical protein
VAPDPIARAAQPKLRRRPALAAAGVALVGLGGLTAAFVATSLDSSTPTLVAARDVSRGEVLTEEDLAVARLSGLAAGAALPGGQLATAVGQTAVTDLPAGMPVPPTSLVADPIPGPGQSVVGIKLAPGQLPTVALRPGDRVRVVGTPRAQDDAPGAAPPAAAAVVASTGVDETSGHAVVNVVLPAAQAPTVAALAATGRVALILDDEG